MKIVYTLIALFSYCSLNAQKAGTLDSSFGVDGKVITSSELGYLNATAATSRSDGSIIVAGDDGSLDGFSGMLAMKYSADGLLDSSFGNKGLAVVYGTGYGLAVAAQPDNKIIIAGYDADLFGPYYVNVARLNANGSIDSSFASIGFIRSLASDRGDAIAIQPDGKILITGSHKGAATTLRYLPNGTPDVSFGNNGVVETQVSGSSIGYAILVQPDGKIVVAGSAEAQILLIRYTSIGALDETFGNNGIIRYNNIIGSDGEGIHDIALQPDGKIVAVGTAAYNLGNTTNTVVLRYLPNGTLDNSFGDSGLSIYKLRNKKASLTSVALQKDGKIITAGNAGDINGTTIHFLLERYNNNGKIDSGFGFNGYQITEMSYDDIVRSIILQKNGKIVLAGGASDTATGPSAYEVALARYNNDDLSKKQIIIKRIKHYIQTHNDAQATTLNTISVYPNPAQNILHVEGLSSIPTKLTVVDFNGNIAISQQLSANSYSCDLNIASLHAGSYMLKIETNGEVVTKQFVKE